MKYRLIIVPIFILCSFTFVSCYKNHSKREVKRYVRKELTRKERIEWKRKDKAYYHRSVESVFEGAKLQTIHSHMKYKFNGKIFTGLQCNLYNHVINPEELTGLFSYQPNSAHLNFEYHFLSFPDRIVFLDPTPEGIHNWNSTVDAFLNNTYINFNDSLKAELAKYKK